MHTEQYSLPPFQSYFWVYMPAGDIEVRKPKKTGDLKTAFAREAAGNNPLSARLCDVEHLYAADTRHLTLFEQPRTPEKPGEYRYQPMQTMDHLVDMIESAQDVATDYMPMELGGSALEIVEKTNKVHLALRFNPEAEDLFDEFYTDVMHELAEGRVHDLYKETRRPRVFLSKAYKSEFRGVDIKAARKSFNETHDKFPTRPVMFDRLLVGQGLFDVHGKNLARRDVATIHFDGRPFDWHCGDPFDMDANARLVAQTSAVRAQARAGGPTPPLPVS